MAVTFLQISKGNITSAEGIVTFVAKIYFPIVVVIGFTGNILTLIILSQKQLIALSSTIFLICLGVADMCVLVFQALFKYILYKAFGIDSPLWLYTFLCVYNHWLLVASVRTSYWITIGFTIERWITITFPVKGKLWCTKKRAKISVAIIALCAVIYALPELWLREIRNEEDCVLSEFGNRYGNVIAILNACVMSITYVLLITFNIAMIFTLRKKRPMSTRTNSGYFQEREQRLQNRVTYTLLLVSITFIILNFPWLLNYLHLQLPDNDPSFTSGSTLDICAEFIGVLNSAVNFFLYTFSSSRFRNEGRKLMKSWNVKCKSTFCLSIRNNKCCECTCNCCWTFRNRDKYVVNTVS